MLYCEQKSSFWLFQFVNYLPFSKGHIHPIYPNGLEYIHETSQMGASYQVMCC